MNLTIEDLVTVSRVANAADVSVATVHQWERTGVLIPAARLVNGTRLYDRAAVARVVADRAARRLSLCGEAEQVAAVERLAYRVSEWAAAMGVSRSKAYELLASGQGPRVMKIGSSVRIPVDAAREWMERQESK